jgi:hypothetical protein
MKRDSCHLIHLRLESLKVSRKVLKVSRKVGRACTCGGPAKLSHWCMSRTQPFFSRLGFSAMCGPRCWSVRGASPLAEGLCQTTAGTEDHGYIYSSDPLECANLVELGA